MKIYTIKDTDGILYPKAFLAVPTPSQAVKDGNIVDVDLGMDSALDYINKSKGQFTLAICELTEIN